MRMRWTFLALVVALMTASAAAAQNRSGLRKAPTLAPPDTLAFLKRETRRIPDQRRLVEDPVSTPLRNGVVGSLPVARNLDFRVGLLKVLRGKSNERSLSRMHSMRDFSGRHERVAAAGVNLRF